MELSPQTMPAAKPPTGRVIGHGAGPRARRAPRTIRPALTSSFRCYRYQRAAREVWKFCRGTGGGHVEWVADQLRRLAEDNQVIDWWARGAPHRRSNPT